MAVTIKIGESEATVLDGKWSSRDRALKAMLTRVYTLEVVEEEYVYTPWPDYTLAEMVVTDSLEAEMEAKITKSTDPPEYVEGRVY